MNYRKDARTAQRSYEGRFYRILGACFEVYQGLGRGFLEPVYQECLEMELAERGVPFVSQQLIPIAYKGRTLEQFYKADLVCYEDIILELKAISQLADEHRAQVFNYLKATRKRLGILINFGSYPKLEYDRIVL